MTPVRKQAVAGSFYPEETNLLNSQLDNFLQQTKVVSSTGNLKILIVPHAGIVYSGKTAAWGFKQIEGKNYQRIILLGASHQAWFDHAAVFDKGSWETPLGKVGVDQEAAAQILSKKDRIISDLQPHWAEHDLEVELIFLQKVLKSFKIVPVLVSDCSDQLIDCLAKNLQKILDGDTLLIVSSDLSHYPDDQTANKVDGQTIEAIVSGDKKRFEQTIQSFERLDCPGLETAACGYQAIKVALAIGEKLHLRWKKIFYENSAAVSGDRRRVVGYASIAGYI